MTRSDYTDKEMKGVEKLRERLKGIMSPDLYDDTNMFVRFLRARNHDISSAEIMLKNHLEWRKVSRIDTIMQWYSPTEVSRQFLPFSEVCFDYEGAPVSYLPLGNVDLRGLWKSSKLSETTNFILNFIEQHIVLLTKKQSEKMKRNIDKFVFILNMESFPISLATHKPSIEAVGRILSIYDANYPERLKLAFVINAPWYFQIAFTLIKPILSGPTLQKIKIYGKDGWQEDIQKSMDVDDIPAFLGGNKTDPDGNPMCRSFINHGGVIPEKYYFENTRVSLTKQPGVRKLLVNRLAKVQVELQVPYPGSEIEWEFETKGKDIAFTLLFKDIKCSNKEAIELLPKQRVDTTATSESGVFKSEKAGTYYIEFDNSYSWINQKEVFYKVKVTPPHVIINDA